MKIIPLCLLVGTAIVAGGFFGVKTYTDSRYSDVDLVNGQTQFTNNCLVCHGDRGHGDGVLAISLNVKPNNIAEELNNPLSMKFELIDFVLEGDNEQSGTMPAFKGMLSEQDVNDILEYVKSIN